MSLGLFDVVGPIMHGPSSSHTAGANRIGYMAGKIMGGVPQSLEFGFHPTYFKVYAGHLTHVALTAGCLGYREDQSESRDALKEAQKRNLEISCYPIDEVKLHRNTMRTHGRFENLSWEINGVSLGGGNILINKVNGVEISLDGNHWGLILLFANRKNMEEAGKRLSDAGGQNLKASCHGKDMNGFWMYCAAFAQEPDTSFLDSETDLVAMRKIAPLYKFRFMKNQLTVFSTFKELLKACADKSMLQVVLDYEEQRSLQSHEMILQEAHRLVEVCREGLSWQPEVDAPLIGRLCSGGEGRRLFAYAQSGKTLMGAPFNLAMARAVRLAEINGSAGKVIACPTGGAAGTLPGVLLTVAEVLGVSDELLAQSFLIAAACGVVIGNHASFSGAVGGCQGEVGIAAAMAAAGAAWMAGASPEGVVHACALALKNILGLTCDPPASPVEVPCIKRNGMGVSVAMMGAEMALAGLRSMVDPDDVVLALADTQHRLPSELKGSCGGLASTESAQKMRDAWDMRLQAMEEEGFQ